MVTHTGRRVAKLRAAHGESLRDASVRTGVSHTTIARIETGEVTRSFTRTMKAIADGYGVSVEWLLTGKNGPTDFDLQLRLAAADDAAAGRIPPEQLGEYVRLIKKAVTAGIHLRALDMAIDVMAQQHRSLAVNQATA